MIADSGRGRRSHRIAVLVIGIGILIWLPFEDRNENPALFFSLLLCSLAGAFILHRIWSNTTPPIWAYPLLGTLCGAALPLAAVLLMAVKTGLHSMPPDYSIADLSVLMRIPVWAGVGFLLGLVRVLAGISSWKQPGQN
jgi:hypothetical protein